MSSKVSELYNVDCLEYMKTLPDKFFDLAIIDPPYGRSILKKTSFKIMILKTHLIKIKNHRIIRFLNYYK